MSTALIAIGGKEDDMDISGRAFVGTEPDISGRLKGAAGFGTGSCSALVDTWLLGRASFEGGWRRVIERGVQPRVVVVAQVGLQSLPELVVAVELLAPEELALE